MFDLFLSQDLAYSTRKGMPLTLKLLDAFQMAVMSQNAKPFDHTRRAVRKGGYVAFNHDTI